MAVLSVALLTAVIAVAAGLLLDRVVSAEAHRPADEQLVSILAFGLIGTGLGSLVFGEFRLLYRPTFWIAAVGALVVVGAMRATVWDLATRSVRAIRRDITQIALPGLAAIATYAVAVDLSMRAPIGTDEADYKWFTPLQYAIHHHVVWVNARLSNGIYLSELLVVPAATFRSLHGARLVQLLAVALLALSARVIARRLGGSGNFAAFAVLGSLIVVTMSLAVGSDVLVAALLVAALVPMLRGDRRGLLAGGLILAGAVSTKQYTALLVPLFVVLAVAVEVDADGVRFRAREKLRARIGPTLTRIAVPVAILIILGVLQTWALVGKPVDQYGLGIFPASDVRVHDGRAAGRIPELRDIALLPAVPAFVGVKDGEPYGRRAGLVLPLAGAAILLGAVLADARWRRRILYAAVVGGASFLLVAPVFIKTRFLIFSWVMVFVAADVAVASQLSRGGRWSRRLTAGTAQLVLLIGFADAARWILQRYWWSQIF